jgi:glutamate synthase domain-containing protein 3
MSETEKNPEVEVNASTLTHDQLLEQLSAVASDTPIRVTGLDANNSGVLSGLDLSADLQIDSAIGSYAFMAARQSAIVVAGNAGDGCGHSLQSGSILVRGDAKNFLAAYAVSGYIAVHGRAGDYAAYGLAGADVLIRSRCGNGVATRMSGGTLVLGNGCGENLGEGMTGGIIYVRGEVGSVAPNVQASRLKEAETIRLSLMLVRAGIKTTYEKFQVYRARSEKAIPS